MYIIDGILFIYEGKFGFWIRRRDYLDLEVD